MAEPLQDRHRCSIAEAQRFVRSPGGTAAARSGRLDVWTFCDSLDVLTSEQANFGPVGWLCRYDECSPGLCTDGSYDTDHRVCGLAEGSPWLLTGWVCP